MIVSCIISIVVLYFFFFKQKTAYEMRISDCSSDVCSSDLLLLFQKHGLDVVVLEVGLGGRLDAVNIVDADCAIVTSVDMDHMQWLGDTREKIGWEKRSEERRVGKECDSKCRYRRWRSN